MGKQQSKGHRKGGNGGNGGTNGAVKAAARREADEAARSRKKEDQRRRDLAAVARKDQEQAAAAARVVQQQAARVLATYKAAKSRVEAAQAEVTAAELAITTHAGKPLTLAKRAENKVGPRIRKLIAIIKKAEKVLAPKVVPAKQGGVVQLAIRGFAPVAVQTFAPPPDDVKETVTPELTAAKDELATLRAQLAPVGIKAWETENQPLQQALTRARMGLEAAQRALEATPKPTA